MQYKKTVAFAVKALSNQIRRLIDNRTADSNMSKLTGMQHAVIGFIGEHMAYEDIYQKDIESTFNIRRSTATGILQLMEKNGLIERQPVPQDARLKKLVLTEKSYVYHQKASAELQRIEDTITAGLTKEELDSFYEIIQKISDNLK